MRRRDLFSAAALFALALGYFSLSFTRTLDLRDEGYLLARGAETAAGALPHRDFRDVYGPAVFPSIAALLTLGGGEIVAVRFGIAILKAVAVLAGFALLRRCVPLPWALVAALLATAYWGRQSANLNAPYAALFTLPMAGVAALFALRGFERNLRAGFVWAGLFAGASILFKHPLGLALGAGIGLAIVAVAMIEQPAHAAPARGRSRMLLTALWIAAGAFLLVPAAAYLDRRGYLMHLLPIHVLMAVVWAASLRCATPDLPALIRDRLAPYVAGLVVLPVIAVLVYAALGGADRLLPDLVGLPLSLRRYALPASAPPAAAFVALAGALALAAALLLGLAGRARAAAALGLLGGLAIAVGRFAIPSDMPRIFEPAVVWGRWPFAFEGVLAPALTLAALVSLAPRWWRGPSGPASDVAAPLLLLFLACTSVFEVFPRAGSNLWILHGAIAPLFGVVLYRAWSLAHGVRHPQEYRARLRALAAALIVLCVPLWLVSPIVVPVLSGALDERRALALPRTRGLAFDEAAIEREHYGDVEELVAWLALARPHDAPLWVLGNDEMLSFLSARPLLFAERRYELFLAGWGMLPRRELRALDDRWALARLRDAKGAILVHRADPTATNLRRALPKLSAFVDAQFVTEVRFGVYRVLRRRVAPGG